MTGLAARLIFFAATCIAIEGRARGDEKSALSLSADALLQDQVPRVWTDASGKHAMKATLIQLDEKSASFKKDSGDIVTVEIRLLSADDRKIVESLLKNKRLQDRAPEPTDFAQKIVNRREELKTTYRLLNERKIGDQPVRAFLRSIPLETPHGQFQVTLSMFLSYWDGKKDLSSPEFAGGRVMEAVVTPKGAVMKGDEIGKPIDLVVHDGSVFLIASGGWADHNVMSFDPKNDRFNELEIKPSVREELASNKRTYIYSKVGQYYLECAQYDLWDSEAASDLEGVVLYNDLERSWIRHPFPDPFRSYEGSVVHASADGLRLKITIASSIAPRRGLARPQGADVMEFEFDPDTGFKKLSR